MSMEIIDTSLKKRLKTVLLHFLMKLIRRRLDRAQKSKPS